MGMSEFRKDRSESLKYQVRISEECFFATRFDATHSKEGGRCQCVLREFLRILDTGATSHVSCASCAHGEEEDKAR